MYLNNVNGLSARADSVANILQTLKPDIVVFCETKASNAFAANFLKNQCYEPVVKKRLSPNSGGIVIAVRGSWSRGFTDSTASHHQSICSAMLKTGNQSLKIIAAYGPQETEKKEIRETFYEELAIEIGCGEEQDCVPIVLGDLNSKIEKNGSDFKALSANGELLLKFMNDYNLNAVNFLDICEGKWTRQNRCNSQEKSVLDYILVQDNLVGKIFEATVDENLHFTPFNVHKTKGQLCLTYTDHNAIFLKFKDMLKKPPHQPKKLRSWWKTDCDGLQKFNIMTDHHDAIIFDSNKSVQDNFDCMNDQLNAIMRKCFKMGSSKSSRTPECNGQVRKTQKILQQIAKEGKVQRSVASHYLKFLHEKVAEKVFQRKAARIADVAVKLTEEEKFSTNKFWQLKKSQSKKNSTKCSVLSRNNVELFSDTAILQEYENEFVSRLSLRQISESLKEYEERSNLLLNMILEGSYDLHDEPDFTRMELDRAIADLKNNAPGADLIPAIVFKNSGQGLRNSYLKLINSIKNKREDVPKQFDDVIITAIHKKGPMKLLENKRGIFLTIALSKIIEKMIKFRINPNLRKVNKLQSGNTENRSCADTTFLLRGVLDHSRYVNKPVYILTYDYTQCFDSLWLEDCLLSLWDLGVSTQLLNMMYKMNKSASVTVNTPNGCTNQFCVERIVKQGTVLGPGLCSSSTAEFADENVGGVAVGSLSIGSLLYVDDMNLLCMNAVETQKTHFRAMSFSKRKRLKYKQKKCLLMIANKKKQDAVPVLDIDGTPMAQANLIKVLGDLFNDKCNNKDLIDDRLRRANLCIVNSMSLCNELSLGIYSLQTLLVIYRAVFLSSVLFNAQAWSNIKKTEFERLQVVQLKYLKRTIKASPSCPNAGTFLEFGILPIAYEIHVRQLNFLHHILNLVV